ASVNVGAKPGSPDAVEALLISVRASYTRLDAVRDELTDVARLRVEADAFDAAFRASLDEGKWDVDFPGRLILKQFAQDRLAGAANYEAFRNLVLDKMTDDNYRPEGMQSVINVVLKS
ncbi:MAG: hypothetical protein ACRETL_12130, partial [Gammaproteobacteria bacterium]